jgi:hypothetical protein
MTWLTVSGRNSAPSPTEGSDEEAELKAIVDLIEGGVRLSSLVGFVAQLAQHLHVRIES